MHKAIKSFFNKRANFLRVTNQAVVLHKNSLEIVGIGFYYKKILDDVNITPAVFIPLDKYIDAVDILGNIGSVSALPSSLVLQAKTGKFTVPKAEVGAVINNFTGGDFIDLPAEFFKTMATVSSFFTPSMVYFVNEKLVIVLDEFSVFCAVLKIDDIPLELRGMCGAIADNVIYIDKANVSFSFSDKNWHLVVSQHLEDEQFDCIFSSLKAADIDKFAPLLNKIDNCNFTGSLKVNSEVKKAVSLAEKYDNISLMPSDNNLVFSGNSFTLDIYNVIKGDVPNFLVTHLKPFLKGNLQEFDNEIIFGNFADGSRLLGVINDNLKIVRAF